MGAGSVLRAQQRERAPELAALAKFMLEYLSTEDLEGEPDEEGPGGH